MAQTVRGAGGASPHGSLSLPAVAWGLVAAFGCAAAAGTLLGLAAAFSSWDNTPGVFQGASYASIAVAGAVAARRARRLGWLHGGLVGVAYMVLAAWAFAPAFQGGSLLTAAGLAKAALVFLAGSVGGIVGRLAAR